MTHTSNPGPLPMTDKPMLTDEEMLKFFAGVYVQGWDQHIGRDGATAIMSALSASDAFARAVERRVRQNMGEKT